MARSHIEAALVGARAAGWTVVRGWAAPLGRERVVCTGWVSTRDDARRALLAAVSGAGLVIGCSVDRDIADRLLDDLRRLGHVQHLRAADRPPATALSNVERALLGLVAEGLTIREAAVEVGVSLRTADRRLASARDHLGVGSTAAAVLVALSKGR